MTKQKIKVEYLDTTLVKVIKANLHPDFTFLQIGANDGKMCDPIFDVVKEFKLKGFCVEPIKDYFDRLKENYADCPSVTCVNTAINTYDGSMTMYKVRADKESEVPEWAKGIASSNPEHHQRSLNDKTAIEDVIVDCMTLENLIRTHSIDQLDLLLIDTEGFDYHIVKMVDFNKIQPRMIYFEHNLYAGVMTVEQLQELTYSLLKNGYNVHIGSTDCFAYKR